MIVTAMLDGYALLRSVFLCVSQYFVDLIQFIQIIQKFLYWVFDIMKECNQFWLALSPNFFWRWKVMAIAARSLIKSALDCFEVLLATVGLMLSFTAHSSHSNSGLGRWIFVIFRRWCDVSSRLSFQDPTCWCQCGSPCCLCSFAYWAGWYSSIIRDFFKE